MTVAESVYRHLSLLQLQRAYRRALRKYNRLRNQAFYNIAEEYLAEAKALADEIDRRHR